MKNSMNEFKATVALVITMSVSSTPAWAETTARLAEKLARFERYAGEPVELVRNYRLYRWQPLGREELAIWSNPKDVYLVRVHGPCSGLDFAKTIGTTTRGGVRRNRVSTTGRPCRCRRYAPLGGGI